MFQRVSKLYTILLNILYEKYLEPKTSQVLHFFNICIYIMGHIGDGSPDLLSKTICFVYTLHMRPESIFSMVLLIITFNNFHADNRTRWWRIFYLWCQISQYFKKHRILDYLGISSFGIWGAQHVLELLANRMGDFFCFWFFFLRHFPWLLIRNVKVRIIRDKCLICYL